jgi:hypothetical protein
MLSAFDANSSIFARLGNSSRSDPAIMRLVAFNFKERVSNILK